MPGLSSYSETGVARTDDVMQAPLGYSGRGYPFACAHPVMDNRSYPSHSDRSNFNVESVDISEHFDTDSEDDESNSKEESWLTDE